MQLSPTDLTAWLQLARAYALHGSTDLALAGLERAATSLVMDRPCGIGQPGAQPAAWATEVPLTGAWLCEQARRTQCGANTFAEPAERRVKVWPNRVLLIVTAAVATASSERWVGGERGRGHIR